MDFGIPEVGGGWCPGTKPLQILKDDCIFQAMSTHSSLPATTPRHYTVLRNNECHNEVREWREVKTSSVIYPKYKFLSYNLIYMHDQTIRDLWHCGKSLGNKSIQVL